MKSAIILASLTVLSLAAPTLAATTDRYQYKGESAEASFYQSDKCNYTSLGVSAFDNISKTAPGSPTSQKEAYLYYYSYNYCNGTGSYGSGVLTNPNFTISNLRSATLSGTFTVTDYFTGNTKNAAVSLEWIGDGDSYRGRSQSTYQGPGYFSKYQSVGSSRNASVTGNVTVDGTDLIANLSTYGSLNSSTSGSMFITKP
ncbi:MAG TPA: hypothetical protein VE956_24255 [Nodularia sp. (in: cyanobacteria)]|nr:hypothetical protein [Nodularia sp. (in: cyanobacteria)]